MGWFHAAFAAGELEGMEGESCAMPKKVQVPPCPKSLTGIEVIYHMCEKKDWDEAVKDRGAYFPPTFHKDGKFTRASVFKEGLIDVANHFYKAIEGEWICLELNLKLLLDLGVVILPQEEANEGDDGNEEKKQDSGKPVQCFQIYSGITTVVPGLVLNIYPLNRSPCGTFKSLGDPVPFNAKRHPTVASKKVERKAETPTKVPGIGDVPPAKTKAEEPAKSKGGFGSMFGKSKAKK
jgi:hypothetical protein